MPTPKSTFEMSSSARIWRTYDITEMIDGVSGDVDITEVAYKLVKANVTRLGSVSGWPTLPVTTTESGSTVLALWTGEDAESDAQSIDVPAGEWDLYFGVVDSPEILPILTERIIISS